MDCPLCGRKLPPETAFLAQTQTGTECPNCWTRLRNLIPEKQSKVEKGSESPIQPLRRASKENR